MSCTVLGKCNKYKWIKLKFRMNAVNMYVWKDNIEINESIVNYQRVWFAIIHNFLSQCICLKTLIVCVLFSWDIPWEFSVRRRWQRMKTKSKRPRTISISIRLYIFLFKQNIQWQSTYTLSHFHSATWDLSTYLLTPKMSRLSICLAWLSIFLCSLLCLKCFYLLWRCPQDCILPPTETSSNLFSVDIKLFFIV